MDSKEDFMLFEELPRILIMQFERFLDRKVINGSELIVGITFILGKVFGFP